MTQHNLDKPEFRIVPYREDEISQANYETALKIALRAIPLLRKLRDLNWKIEVVGGWSAESEIPWYFRAWRR
jgi:hypothetical protein